jgi:hypothetical protein
MFKPYACLACEKIIFDQENVASLISLFNKLIVVVPSEAEIPKNAIAPKEWAIYSSWDGDAGDELKENFLCTQVVYPDGSPFGEISKFKMDVALHKRAQVNAQVHGFPIGQKGSHTIRTWVEESEKIVSPVIEFRMDLEIIRQKQPK